LPLGGDDRYHNVLRNNPEQGTFLLAKLIRSLIILDSNGYRIAFLNVSSKVS